MSYKIHRICTTIAFVIFMLFQRGCIQKWFQDSTHSNTPSAPAPFVSPSPDGIHYKLSYFTNGVYQPVLDSMWSDTSAQRCENRIQYFEGMVAYYQTVIMRMETVLNSMRPGMPEPIVCRDDWAEICSLRESIVRHKEGLLMYQNYLNRELRNRERYSHLD